MNRKATEVNPKHILVMSPEPGAIEVPKERRDMILGILDVTVKHFDIPSYYDMPKSRLNTILRCGSVEKKKNKRLQ